MRFPRLTLRIASAAVFGVLLAATTSISAQAKPAPPGPGNSPSAQACSNGGWQDLVTSPAGAAFASQDACVAYAAHGGVLATKPPPQPLRFGFDSVSWDVNNNCIFAASGTGLLPGAPVTSTIDDAPGPSYGVVSPQGTWSSDTISMSPTQTLLVLSSVAADGTPVSAATDCVPPELPH